MSARVGEWVLVPVTDHPRYPHHTHDGQTHQFATREQAQALCDAWNSYGGDLPWYPERLPGL